MVVDSIVAGWFADEWKRVDSGGIVEFDMADAYEWAMQLPDSLAQKKALVAVAKSWRTRTRLLLLHGLPSFPRGNPHQCDDPCRIDLDGTRSGGIVCVVQRTAAYRQKYHHHLF